MTDRPTPQHDSAQRYAQPSTPSPTPLEALEQALGSEEPLGEHVLHGLRQEGYAIVRADSPSPEGAEPLDPAVAAWRRFSDRFARGEGGDTPIRDAFAAGWDAGREAALPEPPLDVPDMSVLTAVLDDVPGRIRDTLHFDGEAMAAWIIGQWPEYVRVARLRGTGDV